MRIEATCKCGAEFKVRAVNDWAKSAVREWYAMHHRCLGIASMETKGDGTFSVKHTGQRPAWKDELARQRIEDGPITG